MPRLNNKSLSQTELPESTLVTNDLDYEYNNSWVIIIKSKIFRAEAMLLVKSYNEKVINKSYIFKKCIDTKNFK
jgi:hypothetical protein